MVHGRGHGSTAPKHAQKGARSGISKSNKTAPRASFAEALKRQSSVASSAAGGGGRSLHLAALCASEDSDAATTVRTLLDCVRECVGAAGGALSLAQLGGLVRERLVRRGQPGLHKQVHKQGGWEGFVREHANSEFAVDGDRIVERTDIVAEPTTSDLQPQPRRDAGMRADDVAAAFAEVGALSLRGDAEDA